ncbi:sugar phosphate isomerase/epimerase [bacterium]|nr:sugar phosphate isomerase/epimerase [bacterium]
MELKCVRHLWGVEDSSEATFLKIQQKGYAGIEAPLPITGEAERFQGRLHDFGFFYIPQIFTQGRSVDQHLESFAQQVEACTAFKPVFINAHSGRDAWTEAESSRFFVQALEIEAQMGVTVAHETHRGRILYNPWVTSRLLTQFPTLKLCGDFSHWVCVCERLLDTETEIIQQAAEQCLHVHARVGYEEGPQVPDPRAPRIPPPLGGA